MVSRNRLPGSVVINVMLISVIMLNIDLHVIGDITYINMIQASVYNQFEMNSLHETDSCSHIICTCFYSSSFHKFVMNDVVLQS